MKHLSFRRQLYAFLYIDTHTHTFKWALSQVNNLSTESIHCFVDRNGHTYLFQQRRRCHNTTHTDRLPLNNLNENELQNKNYRATHLQTTYFVPAIKKKATRKRMCSQHKKYERIDVDSGKSFTFEEKEEQKILLAACRIPKSVGLIHFNTRR